MKLLLTSGGITHTSISDAPVDLLGKPIPDSTTLCVPTALWGHPLSGPGSAQSIAGRAWGGMTSLEGKSLDVLELTALPTITACLPTPSTTRAPSPWSTARSTSSPKGAGGCSPPG